MSKNFSLNQLQIGKLLHSVQASLSELNDFKHHLEITDFVRIADEKSKLLVKESADEAEVAVVLEPGVLERLLPLNLPEDFSLDHFGDLSIMIEELSHFNLYCRKAQRSEKVSVLELEVQAEVDKFGLVLDWLDVKNQEELKHQVFSVLFDKLELGNWVAEENRLRYQEAHHIARAFCRSILAEALAPEERRQKFQKFFRLNQSEKLAIKF